MKTAVVALATYVAVVSAAPGAVLPGVPINCAKANANYCMSGDIILRCDASGMGARGRCSANVAGYPPAGGAATCYQSSEEAGDAACQKNCVVYAAQPFTLAADKCTPSATVPVPTTGSQTGSRTGSQTGSATIPEGTSLGTASSPAVTKPAISETGILSIPEGTSRGSAIVPAPTETGIMSIPEGTSLGTAPTSKLSDPIRTSTVAPSQSESDDCPVPTVAPTTPKTPATSQPATTSAVSTTGTSAVPTAAANANQAAGVVAAAGLVAALFL
ncbi:hypothetical protein C2857_001261 [Epichloe festucae Fl1]|uniref:Uncharacterized protein n=1 Tax=Epichloe festucae (strain Fl1) TaxID=877507 RepID=A0A7S9KUD2_EPIFF|nr:hypothetical protein C2857_001261 [Epichloe festucae Fl1]